MHLVRRQARTTVSVAVLHRASHDARLLPDAGDPAATDGDEGADLVRRVAQRLAETEEHLEYLPQANTEPEMSLDELWARREGRPFTGW